MNKQLFDELEPAMLNACLKSLDKHEGEHFYSVVLYTSAEYRNFVDSIATIEGLESAAINYLDKETLKEKWKTMPVARKELKWSPSDLPYHCEFASEFGRVNKLLVEIWQEHDKESMDHFLYTCGEIHETGIAVLSSVRDYRIFENHPVVFNLGMLALSDEELYFFAEQVNSDDVLKSLRSELTIDEEVLRELRSES